MAYSWQRRLGISVSVVWLLLWIAGYLMDPFKDLRTSAFGITLFGITPVPIGWFAWWVWEGFKREST
jgi:hypothetical protein